MSEKPAIFILGVLAMIIFKTIVLTIAQFYFVLYRKKATWLVLFLNSENISEQVEQNNTY